LLLHYIVLSVYVNRSPGTMLIFLIFGFLR